MIKSLAIKKPFNKMEWQLKKNLEDLKDQERSLILINVRVFVKIKLNHSVMANAFYEILLQ